MAEQEEKKQKTQQMEEKNTYKIESTKKEKKREKCFTQKIMKFFQYFNENLFPTVTFIGQEFEVAIQGYEFVFHLSYPFIAFSRISY
ncbi:hypothetical protein H5410_050022 [Solanum commersonii]|uniref:Uncharacterized protein n=1 Tax=Solanum commersonii TaxID=4109 RepID=A0A9J5WU60_SOLCO|nr:hypothetical protein H5410_050022 [Solanum commersonii]